MKRMKKYINFFVLCMGVMLLFNNKVFATEITNEQLLPDCSWYGDGSASEYIVSDVEDLLGFASIVNGHASGDTLKDSFKNKTIVLNSNVDLTDVTWIPIGSSNYSNDPSNVTTKMFEGTFDGGNCVIKGLNATNYIPEVTDIGEGEYSFGFFGYVHGGSIKNINFSDVNIICNEKDVDGTTVYGAGVATLIGQYVPGNGVTSVIENCHVLSGVVEASNNMGGLIGYCKIFGESIEIDLNIKRCTNSATVIAEARDAGGIMGLFQNAANHTGSVKFENCINFGNVTTEDGGGSSCAAGILARDNSSNSRTFKIYFVNCINEGKITVIGQNSAEVHASGIGNVYYGSGSYLIAKNCTNSGDTVVEGTPSDIFADGIFAFVPTRTQSICFNLGTVVRTDEKVRITYDSNGAEFLTTYKDFAKNTEVTISNTTAVPTRVGYTFLGWNTKSDGTGTFYKDGEKITLIDSIILYAQWGKMNETWGVISVLDEIYTGMEIKPNVVVINSLGEVIEDGYDVAYSNNVIDVGSVTITVNYNNEVIEVNFNILKDEYPSLSIMGATINYGESYSITAVAKTQSENEIVGDNIIELMYYSDEACNKKLDTAPVDAGKYYVKARLKATNNYAESFSNEVATIEIKKSTPTLAVSISDWVYGEEASVPTITENSNNGTVVYYYKNVESGDSEYITKAPENAGKYILKAVIEESLNYNEVSTTAEFFINKKAILANMIVLDKSVFEYDGTLKTPQVVVKDFINGQEQILIEDTDYIIDGNSEISGDAVKEYVIKITGIGNYSGDAMTNWKIEKAAVVVNRKPSSSKTYQIKINIDGEGDVRVSDKTPRENQIVNVELVPTEDYELTDIKILDEKGNELKLNKNGDNKYKFIQKDEKVVINVLFEKIVEEDSNEKDDSKNELKFTDVKQNDWYYESVNYIVNNKLMNGVSEESFDPLGSTTRAMFITVIWRLENSPVVNYYIDAEDVENDMWYTEAIRWALAEKIIEGYGDRKIGCNDVISREQIVTILYRYANYKKIDTEIKQEIELTFNDESLISEWAKDAFYWAIENETISGRPFMMLAPKDKSTRAELATMIMRFDNILNK